MIYTCMQPLCLDCVVSNTVVASNFKLKKSTDKALVCLYEIYFICVIHLINLGKIN